MWVECAFSVARQAGGNVERVNALPVALRAGLCGWALVNLAQSQALSQRLTLREHEQPAERLSIRRVAVGPEDRELRPGYHTTPPYNTFSLRGWRTCSDK